MILMAQICRSACGGASGTAQLVKEKHMMQAVWCIFFLVSLQAGRVILGHKSNSAKGYHRMCTFVLTHYCACLCGVGAQSMKDHDILVAKCVTQKPGLGPLLWLPRATRYLLCQFQALTRV
jgi:hypothetical protein